MAFDYDKYLAKGMKKDDPLLPLLSLMPQFMLPIAHKFGERSAKIGATIDLMIGAVALQHMEAAIADPEGAKEAVKLMRAHLTEKAARVLANNEERH
jgi:hypothetical protein